MAPDEKLQLVKFGLSATNLTNENPLALVALKGN